MLDEFRIASDRKVDYDFINPSGEENREQREALYQSLILKGLNRLIYRQEMLKEVRARKLYSPE